MGVADHMNFFFQWLWTWHELVHVRFLTGLPLFWNFCKCQGIRLRSENSKEKGQGQGICVVGWNLIVVSQQNAGDKLWCGVNCAFQCRKTKSLTTPPVSNCSIWYYVGACLRKRGRTCVAWYIVVTDFYTEVSCSFLCWDNVTSVATNVVIIIIALSVFNQSIDKIYIAPPTKYRWRHLTKKIW